MPKQSLADRLNARAEELRESYVNGNRRFVIDEIMKTRPTVRAVALSALILEGMDSDDRHDLAQFLLIRAGVES